MWLLLALVLGGLMLAAGAYRSKWPALMNRVKGRVIRQYMLQSAGGPYATTDHHLRSLEIPQPAEAVLAALKDLPQHESIVFIIPPDLPDPHLTFYTISYLTSPRPFGKLTCGESPSPIFLSRTAGPVKWLLFYRLNVPADLKPFARKIGPHLALVPVKELRDWRSYCSPSGS
jgi:hypothetical protein